MRGASRTADAALSTRAGSARAERWAAAYTRGMTLAELIRAARGLSPADRVKLADEVMADLEESAEDSTRIDDAWHGELRLRIAEIEDSRVELVDGRETMRLARARIASRRAQADM